MDENIDDQLLKELEEIAEGMDQQDDPNIEEEQASAGIAAVPKIEAGGGSSTKLDLREESTKLTSEAETIMDSAKTPTPAASIKKRGLNMVKKSDTPEPAIKVAEQPLKKKIAARIVKAPPDEPAQRSDATPPADVKVAADGPSKADVKKAPKKAAKNGYAGSTVKRAKNAFMFFCSDKRAALKAEHPDLSMGDMSKKLGELWKEASSEDKDKYKAMAEKDKDRAATERAQVKGPGTTTKPPQKPHAKTAYQLFCDEKRSKMKEANPEAKFGVLNTLLAAKWKLASDADKDRFKKAHQELKAQLPAPEKDKPRDSNFAQSDQVAGQTQSSPDDEKQEEPTKHMIAPSIAPKKVPLASSRQPKKDSLQEEAKMQSSDDGKPPEQDAAEDDTMVAEMMKVDWKAHPAQYIMAETADAKYLVKRKGLDFTDCGMVDARVAKRQRLQQSGQDEAPQSPISIAMVDEWERFQKSFRCAVHAHNDGGELDLDDLNRGSPLEMCSFLVGLLRLDCLGILKEPEFPLHKAGKGQPTIKVPMLELSKAVQRIIEVERKAYEDLREELAATKAALAAKEDDALPGAGMAVKQKSSTAAAGLEE